MPSLKNGNSKVIAINAAHGTEIWRFDPFEGSPGGGISRGLVYWEEEDQQRIFFSAGSKLFSLNANTGKPDIAFGKRGWINLNEGLGRDPGSLSVSSTSPGVIYKNLLIMGSATGEGYDVAPGHIRAYDVRNGNIVWTFHTIPHPGELGYDTWPADAWGTAGGTNAWGGMSLDEKRGIVYLPLGSPAYDYYGGNRKGQNLFGNCLVALEAGTGKYIWHYQTVHHDLWDYDLPCPPNLIRIRHQGKEIDAIAQVSKTGFVYVLDRLSGEPVFPIEERKVPSSAIPGEEAWPTQPFPLKPPPFSRQTFTDEDISNITDESYQYTLKELDGKRYGQIFIPPLLTPGAAGGAEWGGASFDPQTGMLYVNSNDYPNMPKMARLDPALEAAGEREGRYMLKIVPCVMV